MKQWSTLKKLIWLRVTSAAREYSGAIVTFFTSVAKPLKNLIIDLQPIQTGSGTPSPDNVRPISGRTGANAYVSPTQDAADATTYPVTWQTEAGTVYGGSVDVVTGVLTVDRKLVTLTGADNWAVAGTSKFYCPLQSTEYSRSTSEDEQISNIYLFGAIQSGGSTAVTQDKHFYLQRIYPLEYCRVWVYDTAYTLDTFKAMLNATPLQVTYPIVPVTYQLTPQEVTTLVGTNNVWSDSGDVTVRV